MDAFFPRTSPEYLAHAHIREHIFHDPQIGPQLMGLTAAYASLLRFLTAEHLYILPSTTKQLRDLLMSFARDVIHSLISQAKTRIPDGGYTQALSTASTSLLEGVLSSDSNVSLLLALHREPQTPHQEARNREEDGVGIGVGMETRVQIALGV